MTKKEDTADYKVPREKLIAIMKKYRLSCPRVAALVGVQPNTVRKWRSGLRPVPYYAIQIITLTHAAA